MAYLDGLSDEQLAAADPGHRYVTRNPAETPQQRTDQLQRLAEAEARRQRLTPHEQQASATRIDPQGRAWLEAEGRLPLPEHRDLELGRYSADDPTLVTHPSWASRSSKQLGHETPPPMSHI